MAVARRSDGACEGSGEDLFEEEPERAGDPVRRRLSGIWRDTQDRYADYAVGRA
jgi:hypothetical protein